MKSHQFEEGTMIIFMDLVHILCNDHSLGNWHMHLCKAQSALFLNNVDSTVCWCISGNEKFLVYIPCTNNIGYIFFHLSITILDVINTENMTTKKRTGILWFKASVGLILISCCNTASVCFSRFNSKFCWCSVSQDCY